MQDLKLFNTNTLTMSSLEISELTNKRHADVLRDIRTQIFKGLYEINDNAENLYEEIQGVRIILDDYTKRTKEVILDKYHTDILVSGYEIKYRAAIIKRWQDLEQEKLHSIFKLPSNYEEALEDLLVKVKENKILEKQVEFLEPFKTTVDSSKVIFPKKESVFDKERGFKKDVKEICPYLSNDKITNILEFYTTKKYKNTDYYVKDEIEYCVQKFIEDSTQEIRGTKKSVILYHKCLPGGKTIVNKDYAIQYLDKNEEDFN